MNKKLTFSLALLSLLTACGSRGQDSFDTDRLGTIQENISYCSGNSSQVMDFYYPDEGSLTTDEPYPVMVYVHGGGWTTGDKNSLNIYIDALTAQGIAVAAVNYSLAPASVFPQNIEDLKCAVRSLRAHADEYHIDPDRIGGYGGSAGGHLVSLLGLTSDQEQWEVGDYLDYSSQLSVVIDLYGPQNLTEEFAGNTKESLKKAFGDSSFDQAADQSPVTYVDSQDPPFLIIHGEDDALVPIEQSEELYQDLLNAGVDATFIPVKGAGHTFAATIKGVPPQPTMQEIAKLMSDWVVAKL